MKCFIMLIALWLMIQNAVAQINFCGEVVPVRSEDVRNKLLIIVRKNIKNGGLSGKYIQDRINKYLPFIENVLSKYNLPDDLKYLALAESRLNTNIISPAGAAGAWQFMPATAKEMGLLINPDIDERNNIIKSTHAACRLLLSLYKQFGSWTIAAAAYNAGPGRITKVIEQQGTKNYYSMSLNKETGAYIYEILAMKFIHSLMVKNTFVPVYQHEVDTYKKDVKHFDKVVSNNEETDPSQKDIKIIKEEKIGNWQASGWGKGSLIFKDESKPSQDSLTATATLIGNEYLLREGNVTFRLMEDLDFGNMRVARNTLIKGVIYPDSSRIGVDIAGVDVSSNLKEYTVKVYDYLDEKPGMNLNIKGKKLFIGDAYRVKLYFVKEYL